MMAFDEEGVDTSPKTEQGCESFENRVDVVKDSQYECADATHAGKNPIVRVPFKELGKHINYYYRGFGAFGSTSFASLKEVF